MFVEARFSGIYSTDHANGSHFVNRDPPPDRHGYPVGRRTGSSRHISSVSNVQYTHPSVQPSTAVVADTGPRFWRSAALPHNAQSTVIPPTRLRTVIRQSAPGLDDRRKRLDGLEEGRENESSDSE
jgi:hypothetical protein